MASSTWQFGGCKSIVGRVYFFLTKTVQSRTQDNVGRIVNILCNVFTSTCSAVHLSMYGSNQQRGETPF